TREELANVEAEQRRIQQQLVRIERERRELAHTPQAPTTAEAQERTANLERIEAERRRVAAELEAMRATRSQLQQQLEVAQGQAPVSPRPELPVEPQTIPAPAPVADVELAQVEYVAEGNVKPVLVRTKGGELTRTPLTARMRLVAGDKIDIPKAGGTQTAPREARVTVKLWCGPIDLADDTQIEFIDFERVTLARGQLFADLNLAQRNSRAETSGLYQVIVDTPLADVIVEGTRFELATDVLQTRLRMEEGKTSFVSSRGRQQVYALQESVARANAAPTKPTAIDWVSIWRGRRKAPEPQVVSFALINTETRQPIEGFDPLLDGAELKLSKLPTRQFSVRANTVPEQIGSVQFGLNDTPVYRVESFAPYALSGDKEENYSAWNPEAGSYRLTATPYEQANARGKAGKGLTITIRVAP
ncbi:MAG TPA: hypothetical protein VEK08_26025, partial [Planctomycetota bacterium]|nr:hypothetical protein [Planctomycetota bacterium]